MNMSNDGLKIFSMNKSPFHDETLSAETLDKRKTVRFTNEEYNQLNKYFEENNLEFSEGIRSLCYAKLDTICNERKTFPNLEVIMLIPKMSLPYPKDENVDVEGFAENYFEILIEASQIIAIINTDIDFRSGFNHSNAFNDEVNYKLDYELKDFKAENFPMEIIQNTNESHVYRTNEGDLNDFDSFKDRQKELYSHKFIAKDDFSNLNVDDCYFVRFPLNNYLDEFRSGQFQQKLYSNYHEGVYVFEAVNGLIKYYCFINWYYSNEGNNISFEIYFSDEKQFLDEIYFTKDFELINSALSIVDGENSRKRLEDYLARLEDEVLFVNELLAKKN